MNNCRGGPVRPPDLKPPPFVTGEVAFSLAKMTEGATFPIPPTYPLKL